MANYIDTTYFIGDISLPVDSISAQILQKIKTYEPEILTKAVGFDLYKKMLDNPTNQIYIDIVEGKEFQVNEIWYNWRGLTNANKESFIAYYVWFMLVQMDSSFVSGGGMKQLKSENADISDTGYMQKTNYNKMVDWIAEMDFFIKSNIGDYPTYNPQEFDKIPFII